jgi:Undecaprenyl-phosphate glucose phosphotransferase
LADAEHFIASSDRRTSPRGEEVMHRLMLCAIVAGIEAAIAFALVLGVAVAYHLWGLHQSLTTFDAHFYIAYGVLTAFVYGLFAAVACSRLLDRTVTSSLDIQHAFYSWTASIGITLLTAFLLGRVGDFSRVSLTTAYLVGIPVMFAVRNLVQTFVDGRIRRGELHYETIAVMGNRADVLNFLLGGEIWRQGHKLQSTLYFEDARDEAGKLRPELVLQFAQRNLRHGTDQLVLVGDLAQLDAFEGVANELKRYALNLLYAPASRNRTLKFLDVTAIGPNNVLRIVRTPMGETSVILKRAFDIVLSSFGLLLLSPLLALVALLIVLESRGPVIFRQARRGFNGDTFMIWKFRSMRVVESGYQMKQAQKNDPRITRIGRFIRATSIDELPQLVNVLTGQMSLVGPRPHAVSHDEELSHELAVYAHRQRIKPGITGWAQVHGFRGETSTPAQIEGRVAHDIYYIDNWSIFLDIWIIVLTVFHPAARRNAR